MRRVSAVAVMSCAFVMGSAQIASEAAQSAANLQSPAERIVPRDMPATAVRAAAGNGIFYHGGPVLPGTVRLYFVWYGNFVNGPALSDSVKTMDLLMTLFGRGGLGGSGYARINSTYADRARVVTGNFILADAASDYYSRGKNLSDAAVRAVVASAINGRSLPRDANGVYFVLTSSDVNENSGFCTRYCGWHGHAIIAGEDIKVGFVGNPDRCPNACEEQMVSPNGDSGADAMASTMAHEVMESTNDPDLNAWYDLSGNESADKCAWKWGPVTGIFGDGAYNLSAAGRHWLIQMNWENARGGGCGQKLGGPFYRQ
jgi:Phosphate-induced protein 1 conserved region